MLLRIPGQGDKGVILVDCMGLVDLGECVWWWFFLRGLDRTFDGSVVTIYKSRRGR